MKDDRILKPRLRLCPFCGAAGAPELLRIAAVAFVRCNHCKAEGPFFRGSEFLPPDFHELNDNAKSAFWDEAVKESKRRAVDAWNGRPWEGSYFPEDLEDLEQKMKLESGALYGASCSEEAEPCES